MALRARTTKRWVLAAMLLASVLAMLAGTSANHARRAARYVLAPLGGRGLHLSSKVRENLINLNAPAMSQQEAARLRQENEALHGRVDMLATMVADHQQQLAKVQQLSVLTFGPTNDLACELIPARVASAAPLPYGRELTLSARDARTGSPVTARRLLTDRSQPIGSGHSAIALPSNIEAVSTSVLVGRLTDSGPFHAQLQLVTDRGFRIKARIQRRIDPQHPDPSRRALSDANIATVGVEAAGDGKGMLTVSSVKESDGILAGDWLVTRSDEPLLPAQVQIGQVEQVEADPKQAGFVNLKVRPLADLDSLREVFIVAPQRKEGGKP